MQFLYLVHVSWLDVRVESLLREHTAMEDEQVQKTTHFFVMEMSGMGNTR